MKEIISLLTATVVILTLSVLSFNTVANTRISAAKPEALQTKVKESEVKTESEDSAAQQSSSAAQSEQQSEAESENASEQSSETASAAEEAAPAPAPAPAQTPAQTAPAPAPAPAQIVSYAPANNMTSAERLNSVTLNPTYTPYSEINARVNEILASIITPDMTTYQKIRACYDWVVFNCSEGYITGTYGAYYGGWFGEYAQAMALYTEKRGMCDCFSSGFAVLARAVGLNCYRHTGTLRYPGGYWDEHDWVEANINGELYIFDPDVEDDMSGGGTEYRFCKTYSELASEYKR